MVQTAMCANLRAAHGPYLVDHEIEAGGGFADSVWEPDLGRYPEIKYALLIELKYLKKDDDASPAALAKLRREAADQLDRYAADHDLAQRWCLTNGKLKMENGKCVDGKVPSVELKRVMVVFHAQELLVCEEIP